jgi:prolyl-tRNA synthetase
MYQSKLFTKTRKEAPKDEVSKNAQLLIKAGFINKEMAGVYDFLPLGLRVVNKICDIIREEMNMLGGQEMNMTTLQRKELWEKTNRWSDEKVDIWFKSVLKNGAEIGLGWSHEEPITDMMKNFIGSYRDLPIYVYQFQNKLRNELRAKSGIMRGREFLMKDMYSYSIDEVAHKEFYDKTTQAYLRVFSRVGLKADTFVTFASGGAFTQFSHEFQTITEAGEDIIYVDRQKGIAINKEVFNDEVIKQLGLDRKDLEEVRAAEVGNIFSFGEIKSKELDLYYKDDLGKPKAVILGSYGIGVTRLMGVVVEKFSDDKGLVWPIEIAPFKVHLIQIGDGVEVRKAAESLYEELQKNGVEVLFDDRDARPGDKFADSDLFGIPLRIIVSEKTLMAGEYEVKERLNGVISMIKEVDVCDFVKKYK